MLIRSVLFNFQGAFLNSVVLISQTTLLLYHIFSSLSRGFSKLFLIFSWFSSKSMWFWGFLSPLFSSLSIISLSFRFVKRFFKIYFDFSWFIFKRFSGRERRFERQPNYYITLFPFCQADFSSFLKNLFDFRSLCDFFFALLRKLNYYTPYPAKSQHFFWKILHNKFSKFSTELYFSCYKK